MRSIPDFQDRELGEWTGALGYLYRNEADTISLTYEYIQSRDAYFDYSYPIWNVRICCFIHNYFLDKSSVCDEE